MGLTHIQPYLCVYSVVHTLFVHSYEVLSLYCNTDTKRLQEKYSATLFARKQVCLKGIG